MNTSHDGSFSIQFQLDESDELVTIIRIYGFLSIETISKLHSKCEMLFSDEHTNFVFDLNHTENISDKAVVVFAKLVRKIIYQNGTVIFKNYNKFNKDLFKNNS